MEHAGQAFFMRALRHRATHSANSRSTSSPGATLTPDELNLIVGTVQGGSRHRLGLAANLLPEGWDLVPRCGSPHSRLASRCLRPLGHLSTGGIALTY